MIQSGDRKEAGKMETNLAAPVDSSREEDGADAPGTTAEIARWTGEAHDGSEVEKGKTVEKRRQRDRWGKGLKITYLSFY
jgi:hypothetical protein